MVICARHQVLSAQIGDDSTAGFPKRLRLLMEPCECGELTIQEHRNMLPRDGLAAGIKSNAIKARLLKLSDAEASLEKGITLASAIEQSADVSRSFTTNWETPTNCTSGSVAAIDGSSNKPADKATISPCTYCGFRQHKHRKCAAKDSNCLSCGRMGHWATARRSSTAAR